MNSDSSKTDDQTLLRAFAGRRDEAAFRALVEKYTGMVYGVAMRRTGQAEAAEEIAQNVFLVLARKAESLDSKNSLGGWLHRAATLESLKYLRTDANRQRHLTMIRESQETQTPSVGDQSRWRELRPHLDQLLDSLSARDRDILVQHYFEGLQFAEIAKGTGITAAAAQKRSVRALDKLSRLISRRGIAVSSAFLAAGLGAELCHAAPAGLAAKLGASVLASSTITAGTAGAASGFTFSSLLTAMTTSKLAFAAAFLIAASVPVGWRLTETQAAAPLKTENAGEQAPPPRRSLATAGQTVPFDADIFRKSLQRLIESKPVQPDGKRGLERLMFSLSLEEVRSAVAVLDEFENPERLYDIIGAAFARWAELDPEAAIADAVARPPSRWGYYPITAAWQTWAFIDWESARRWPLETKSEYDDSFLFWGFLDGMAQLDGELALKRASELGQDRPERNEQYYQRALGAWIRNDPGSAITWMEENLTDPVKKDALAGSALQSLGQQDPRRALEHLSLLENPERLKAVSHNIFWTWGLYQPAEAADYFESSGAGNSWHESTVRSAAEAISRNDPERAIEISRTIDDPMRRDSFYCGILCGATQSDFSLVLEAANGISEEAARTNDSLGAFLRDWAGRDGAAAAAWVEALPAGGKKNWARHILPR